MMHTEWRLHTGRSGQPTLTFIDAQRQARHLHSLYDPVREAKSLVESWDIDATVSQIYVVGLGLGYHIFACLERYPWLERVVALECHEEVVRLARETVPELLEDERVVVRCTPGESELRNAIGAADILNLHLHPASVSLIPFDDVRALLQEIQMLRSTTDNQAGRLKGNWDTNVSSLQTGSLLTGKRNQCTGRPGLLVAAGPSLDTSLDFIHRNAEGAVLLCVSTALRALLNAGIVPDYCIVSDSSRKIAEHFAGLSPVGKLPELLALGTVRPEIVASYQGEVTWLLQQGFDAAERFAAAGGYDMFLTGGSVATLALSVLYYFGCNPIVLAGQDLAYVGGRTHSDSAHPELAVIEEPSVSTVSVTSVYGQPILSNLSWNSFRHWIERFIAVHADRVYVNISEGAHIQGTIAESASNINTLFGYPSTRGGV